MIKINVVVTKKLCEVNELLSDIEKLRDSLHKLISKKGINLQDPEVLSSSQVLNAAITKYNELISKKI